MLWHKPTGDFKLNIFGTFNETVYDVNDTENYLTIQPQISRSSEINNISNFKVNIGIRTKRVDNYFSAGSYFHFLGINSFQSSC